MGLLALLVGCGAGGQVAPAPSPAPSVAAVFIGDSITAGWHVESLIPGARNRGVPGETPAQIQARFSVEVLAVRPALVHILGGANDMSLYGSPDASIIVAMAASSVAAGIPTYVGTVTPGIDRPQAGVESYNAQIRAAAQVYGYTVVDYYPAMCTPLYFDQSLYLDTVHPNAAGYLRMETVFKATVKP